MGLCMAAQKGPFVKKYYVVLSLTAPKHPSVLPQGRAQKQTERWKVEKKESGKTEPKREKHTRRRRETLSHVVLTVVMVGGSENGIEAKHSVLIFTHKMFSLSYDVKHKKPLNAGLGVIKNLTAATQWLLN